MVHLSWAVPGGAAQRPGPVTESVSPLRTPAAGAAPLAGERHNHSTGAVSQSSGEAEPKGGLMWPAIFLRPLNPPFLIPPLRLVQSALSARLPQLKGGNVRKHFAEQCSTRLLISPAKRERNGEHVHSLMPGSHNMTLAIIST